MQRALGAIFVVFAAALAHAAPSVPGLDAAPLQQPSQSNIDRAELEVCLAEATRSDIMYWSMELSADGSSSQPAIPELLADNESTQLLEHDPAKTARRSQVAFQRCLQRQLNNR